LTATSAFIVPPAQVWGANCARAHADGKVEGGNGCIAPLKLDREAHADHQRVGERVGAESVGNARVAFGLITYCRSGCSVSQPVTGAWYVNSSKVSLLAQDATPPPKATRSRLKARVAGLMPR
jgi:hypothetical protein